MNRRDKQILADYRANRAVFERLGTVVHGILADIVAEAGIKPMAIQHRVKTEESLQGKLIRSGDWYKSFDDLMDVLGARVILYFADEVDTVGKRVEEEFVIDRQYSANKGDLLDPDRFGYLSLHYICTLPADKGYPEELLGRKFEIQIRTCLQHVWSDIDHDIAYKSRFGVPREVKRGFSRLAGLLELVDSEFMRVRDSMAEYVSTVRTQIAEGTADEVSINRISLNEYMQRNTAMQAFLQKLAQIDAAEIVEVDPEAYIEPLASLGITTLGGLQQLVEDCAPLALRIAEQTLVGMELDILSYNAALRFLCGAYLVKSGRTLQQMTDFFVLFTEDEVWAQKQAQRLVRAAAALAER